jgi:hypothetical protein
MNGSRVSVANRRHAPSARNADAKVGAANHAATRSSP